MPLGDFVDSSIGDEEGGEEFGQNRKISETFDQIVR